MHKMHVLEALERNNPSNWLLILTENPSRPCTCPVQWQEQQALVWITDHPPPGWREYSITNELFSPLNTSLGSDIREIKTLQRPIFQKEHKKNGLVS